MNYKELRILLFKSFSIPKERSIRRIIRSFTIAEKAIFYFFVATFILSGATLLWRVNSFYLAEIPTRGGTLTEGVVGNPRFINPVLAISEADKNLTALVYSGLVRITPEGEVKNDLASEVIISDNRLIYTIRIDENSHFHDGTRVTADDVIFTVAKVIDPAIKSPRRGNWDGVTVEKVNEQTVSFILKQAYTPFIYNLTLGILPRHIWKNVSNDEFSFSQFNTLPIGSGLYKVKTVERNPGGIPNFYKLTPSENSPNASFIRNLVFKFYPSESAVIEAYNKGVVESISGISPSKALEFKIDASDVISSPLPRVFAVFFNQNQSKVLSNKEVRQALNLASPREEIIEQVLGGYGTAIEGPLPAGIYSWTTTLENKFPLNERLVEAGELLAKAGWKANEETGVLEKKSGSTTLTLSFSISTGDAPELREVVNELIVTWEKLGAKIDILVFEPGDLNQTVIRPRNFDALLFGEVVGRDADLYPFWHSSQWTDPGLNIALYTNSRADKFLEDARSAPDHKAMEESHKSFTEELMADVPAVFLYTPSFLYVMPEKVENINLNLLTVSQDRFLGIRDWYIETDKVWKIFID
jgi:peptide/nickel transport system substrate-binding protein